MRDGQENPVDGIEVMEEPGAVTPLRPVAAGVVAFVGRTLRGPVGRPVRLHSFTEFERVFGGLWQPAPLGHAVAHFFANGGTVALVVRVVNGAAATSLSLPTAEGGLGWVLRARHPGTREFLRASVDFDGLGADESDEFNLLVQRVRAPGGEAVESQECYPRASCVPGTPRFLGDLLADSALVALEGPWPVGRPAATPARSWICSRPDGDDGAPPTEHDLIGDPGARTGLQALADGGFQWLVLPPPARDRDLGPLVRFVAARFCGERQAMLLVDPPAAWDSAATACAALSDWSLRSADAALWFPWIETHDPLRGQSCRFPPSGAVAGLLSRQEGAHPPTLESSAALPLPPLRPGFALSVRVCPEERLRLGTLGANVPSTVRVPRGQCPPQVTLAAPTARSGFAARLLPRRRWQALLAAVLGGTRWVLFHAAPQGPAVWRPLADQVGRWLASQMDPAAATAGWFVVCDGRLHPPGTASGTVRFLIGLRDGDTWYTTLVTRTGSGVSVEPVSPNAWALLPRPTAVAPMPLPGPSTAPSSIPTAPAGATAPVAVPRRAGGQSG